MKRFCMSSCLLILKIFSTHIWKPSESISNANLPYCSYRKIGGGPCTTMSVQQLSLWTCPRRSTVCPHGLLLEKLKVFGLSTEAVKLLEGYLTNRNQQVRIDPNTSSWDNII